MNPQFSPNLAPLRLKLFVGVIQATVLCGIAISGVMLVAALPIGIAQGKGSQTTPVSIPTIPSESPAVTYSTATARD